MSNQSKQKVRVLARMNNRIEVETEEGVVSQCYFLKSLNPLVAGDYVILQNGDAVEKLLGEKWEVVRKDLL